MEKMGILWWLLQGVVFSSGASNQPPKMAYLTLDLSSNPPKLQEVHIVPGRLKLPAQMNYLGNYVICRMKNAENATVFESVLPMPGFKVGEFEGPDGTLVRQEVALPSSKMLVRVPYIPGEHLLTLDQVIQVDGQKTQSKWVRLILNFDSEAGENP